MDEGRLRYRELFLDSVDYVESGRKGEISDIRRLLSEYDPSYYPIIEPHLKNTNPRVRMEVVLLLSKLGERKAVERIKGMRVSDNDLVSGACLSYLKSIGDDDDAVSQLIETMRHANGPEFKKAAMKLRSLARPEDVDELRLMYGRVDDSLKGSVLQVLASIVARYPELDSKKHLILSKPVYPNEDELKRFLDKSIVYIDIRYRDNYSEDETISMDMYNKIASAFGKIQIRIYNEKANLKYYSDETSDMLKETEKLLVWAIEDLSSKEIIGVEKDDDGHSCPRCGGQMGRSISGWICPDCGHKE